jgi:hypothetical protein
MPEAAERGVLAPDEARVVGIVLAHPSVLGGLGRRVTAVAVEVVVGAGSRGVPA